MAKKATVDPKDYVALPASDDPNDIYAWRKDGVKPVIDLADFARNIHSALDGNPGADFADHRGPV